MSVDKRVIPAQQIPPPTITHVQVRETVLYGNPSLASGRKGAWGLRRILGLMGAATALPFFVWLPLGWLEAVPSLVDVFGLGGLRTPAGITVGGLLLAAVGFHDD